jgi:hypothetical protein
LGRQAVAFVYALVPFGVSIWTAHYAFHLLTGALVVVPVTQSAVIDVAGWPALGDPLWRWAGMRPGSVFPIQLGITLLGAFGSLGVLSLIAAREYPERPGRAAGPWAVMIAALTVAAIWVLYQPMDMRGLGFGA